MLLYKYKGELYQNQEALYNWLIKYSWDFFITITFPTGKGFIFVKKTFEKFIQILTLRYGKVGYFVVYEPTGGISSGEWHIHALLRIFNNVNVEELKGIIFSITHGWCTCKRYNPEQGGLRYMCQKAREYNGEPNWEVNFIS